MDNEFAGTEDSEVVLSAQYSPFKAWVSILLFMFGMFLVFGGAYFCPLKGKYVGVVCLTVIGLSAVIFTLDIMFFKELVFFRDRVTKYWHLFGCRTVWYARGLVHAPDRYVSQFSSAYFIVELGDNGRPIRWRLPIMYIAFFFSADTVSKINGILDYLADYREDNPRIFKRTMLQEEVISPALNPSLYHAVKRGVPLHCGHADSHTGIMKPRSFCVV